MRVTEPLNRFHIYLQRHFTQIWNGMTIRKGCCLGGALAITAALVVCVVKNDRFSPFHIFLGCAAVVVAVPCVIRGCFWLKRKCIQLCNRQDADGDTLLMRGVIVRIPSIVTKALIKFGADTHLRNAEGKTALMLAAEEGEVNAMQALIRAGANIETRDNYGRTAFMLAAERKRVNTVQALILAGANIETRDNGGYTALIHAARRGYTCVMQTLILAGANLEARDNYGQTALMHAAISNRGESVNALIIARASLNCTDRRGFTAFRLAELVRYGDIAQRLRDAGAVGNAPVPLISFALGIRTDHVPRHQVRNNHLSLTINRLNMTHAAAKAHLSVLAEYWRCYQHAPHDGTWANLCLSINYEGERGIDAGGPSREFITQLFKNLFSFPDDFPFFKQTESGQYELFDGMLTMNPQDLQVCRDIGVVLAAGFMGFPRGSQAKIGSVFSDQFYNLLLGVHKYTIDHPGRLNNGFNAMSQEDKETLVLQLANHDLENPSYKEINSCLQKPIEVARTDNELDAFLKFLIDLSFVEDVDPNLSPALTEILEAFKNCPNYAHLLSTPESFTVLGVAGQRYTREAIRGALRTALFDQQQKVYFQTKIARALVDVYQSTCIPLVAVEEGFRSAGIEYIRPFIDQLEMNPQRAAQALSVAIQGPAFTREAFIALLRRSRIENPAVQTKVNWIIEWCDRGIGERGEVRATEEAMKSMLSCITGTEVVTDDLVLSFNEPAQAYSEFHTCGRSVNLGSLLMGQVDKTAFIEMWNEHVRHAHLAGFELG